MAKVALILFAGPEMPCKLQHAFVFARDIVERGGEATILIEGNAPKWLIALQDDAHKLRPMFDKVLAQGLIGGVCKGCAMVHGAVESAEAFDLPLIGDAYGHVSLAMYYDDGYEVAIL